jgi:radical SAM protein with 4Fe4S-binding SPASM domain
MPYRLWIEPTSMCNLKCVMCPNKSLDRDKKGMMDLELFKKAIDEAKDFVHDINLHHRGESLLHKGIYDMIKYAKDRGVVLKLHTNATCLDEFNTRNILESNLDYISFSFDGFDRETYEKYRAGARYDKTMKNILRFLQLKKNLQKNRPFTVLELIDYSSYDDSYALKNLSSFKKQFAGLPLDKILVKKPHNFAGNVDIKTSEDDSVYSPCTFLWHSLIIFWNGDVLPCTQDFHGQLSLGNLKDQSLSEIFHGEKMLSLRNKALTGSLQEIKPCSGCDMIRRRKILGVPVKSFSYLQK